METAEISKLADKLREHGDDVLNGLSKLSLSADQLVHLNKSFTKVVNENDVMTNSFHVINTSSGKLEELTDLQFLHDFVQRIVALKLTLPFTTDELADVTNFKNLKLLEVNKLAVKAVKGVHNFRSRLLYLTCIRSLASLEEILESCGADESSKYVWSELKCANFSHNSLKIIDSSIEMAPFLHTLDLSHNEIQDASALNCLLNLQHLNLSYNKLTRIPLFGVQICSRLQVLVASNNFIEDINEVGALYNLCELDLAQNCLIGHNALVSLASLATLQWLNLKGNPLVYHPQHRTKAASCLHINTNTINFILDYAVLSKAERKYVGSLHPRMYTRPMTIQPSTSQGELSDKFRRIRQVTISDSEPSPIFDPNMSSLCVSLDHLETKKQIEQLVKEYGENWLERKQGLIVQDVLGFEKKPLPQCSTPIGSTDMLIHEEIQPQETFLESSQVSDTKSEAYISASETVVPPDSDSLYENDADDEDEDVVEGDENVYLATIYEKTDQVFIEITDAYIFEREATCSRERTRWPTKSLILCELYKDYIQLYFDTVRHDCRERRYVMEQEEMERLSNTLSDIVAKRPSEDCHLTVYNCIKCSTQFSKDKKLDNCKFVCPTCQSEMVFKADD